jgi:diguanylate cyclase (GGDEF)-like protein
MTLRGKLLVWLRAFLHSAAIAGLVLIAASWFVVGFVSSVERQKAVEEAVKQADSLVRLFEHNIEDILGRFDRTLLLLRKSFEDDPAHFDLRKWAGQTALISEEAFQLALIGPDGFQIATTLNTSGKPLYVGDRPHIQRQMLAKDDQLIISEPVIGRTSGRISLQLLRRLRNPDDSFAGVLLLSVDPNFIEPFYRSVNLGERGGISIRNQEGVILAAQGFSEHIVGRKPAHEGLTPARAKSASGHFWGSGNIDSVVRLISYRTSDRFPLTFTVGLSEENILSEYRQHRAAYIVVASIVTLILLIAIGFAVRYQIRLDNSQRDLRKLNEEISRQNVRFDAALQHMSHGICLYDPEQRVVVANPRYAEIYRLRKDQVKPGTHIRQILQARCENGTNFATDPDVYVSVNVKQSSEVQELADGRVVEIKRQPMANGGWLTTHEDVTIEKRSEKLLAEKAAELEVMNTHFSTALANMAQGLCMFDGEKRLTVWNDRYVELLDMPAHLLKVGTPLHEILTDRVARDKRRTVDDPAVKARVAELLALPPDASRVDQLADGKFMMLTRQPMAGGGWVTLIEDITERRRVEAEIVHLARHDVLTGLANRAEFNARLEEASKRLKRNGGGIAVMMIDLDRFKAVNDTHGHLAGDQLLSEVAHRLQSAVRDTDVLARLGGDEFAIIQEGGPDQREGAVALALRIIEITSKPFDLNGHDASVGVSIGIAMAPEDGIEPGDLLKRADLALYSVKSSGRNDFQMFRNEMLEIVNTQQSAERELREAIALGQFELHYQPVVDVKTRKLCGVEALVRWRHPTRGMIAPDNFIPLAESTGLIAPLGEWILKQACSDAVAWPAHIKVAVNISAIQFKKGNLFEVILGTLVKTGLPPERLELEITETSLLENQEAHLTTIRQLKNLGLSVALDDFGTGFSSINYLTIFPFDKIKIDRSFTKGVLSRADCKAVVASTLALAQGLGIVTTVEGVETEEQFEYMRAAGVELAQGYLFGKPVPIAEFGRTSAALLTALVA